MIKYLLSLYFRISLLTGFLCTIHSADAQIRGLDIIPIDKNYVQVPFEYENGFIILNAWLGGILPVRLIFDTGAENTIIFDKELATLIELEYDRQIMITGSDLDTMIAANISRNVSMRISGTLRVLRDIIVLERNHYMLKERLGIDVHGILGGTYFSNLVVKIDYKHEMLTFYRDIKYVKRLSSYEKFDLFVQNHKPYLETSVQIIDEKPRNLRLLIDSGASLPCLINALDNPTKQLPEKVMPGNVGFGLSGMITGYSGRISQLRFDPFRFTNLFTTFQLFSNDNMEDFKSSRDGLIGNLLLERFDIIIDYAREILYLKPKRKYNAEVRFDKSGLTIYAFGTDLNKYYVVSVQEGSPAAKAGVKQGDLVHRINGSFTRNINLEKINNKLSAKQGRKINMVLIRNDEKIKTSFRLLEWYENN